MPTHNASADFPVLLLDDKHTPFLIAKLSQEQNQFEHMDRVASYFGVVTDK